MGLGRPAVASVVAFLLCLSTSLVANAQAMMIGPQQVVDSFHSARAVGDIDLALAQFADDAVVTVEQPVNASYVGRGQVRQFLEDIGIKYQTVSRSKATVQGSSITWTERDRFPWMSVDASVYAVVFSGRISSLTYRQGTPFDVTDPSALQGQPHQIPTVVWPLGLAAMALLGLAVMFGRPRHPASQSQLDGRLLVELRRQRRAEPPPPERSKAA